MALVYPPPRLPQELVDNIVDHLFDDPSSLSTCARVSPSWLPTSRLHFFNKISLKATSPHNGVAIPQERCKRLHTVLVKNPDIIPYIRELEICEGSPPHHHYPDVNSTTWVVTERTLPALFKMLTHVKRVDFSSTSTLFWKLFPPTFQAALLKLLSNPSLTYIRLHYWIFPDFLSLANLLSQCRNLKGFALSSTAICGDGSRDAPPHSHSHPPSPNSDQDNHSVVEQVVVEVQPERTSLEVLTLDFVTFPYLEYWLLGTESPVDITSIRELRVAHFHDVHVIEKLLLGVGPSLEHFHLKPGSWDVHSFDLSHNTSLRSVRLTLDDPETAMDWAQSFLSTILNNHIPLESIGLEFYADPKKIEGWRGLDALFMQTNAQLQASLRLVEIGLFAIPTGTDFVRVKEEMGGLGERGIVRWYQLGIKNYRSARQLTSRISRFES